MGKHDHRLCNQRRILRISYFSTDYNISVDCKPFANFSVDLRRTGAVYSGTDALQNEKTEGKTDYERQKTDYLPDGRYRCDGCRAVRAGPADRAHRSRAHLAGKLCYLPDCVAAGAEVRHPERGHLSGTGHHGIPVFSGYGAGLAKLAGPTGGYLVGYLLLAFIGGMFIEKSKGNPVVSAVGLVLGDAACYVLGTAWFVFQMQCELGYALTVCVYPFIALDLGKIVVSCIVGALLRKRLTQAGVLKLQNAVSE